METCVARSPEQSCNMSYWKTWAITVGWDAVWGVCNQSRRHEGFLLWDFTFPASRGGLFLLHPRSHQLPAFFSCQLRSCAAAKVGKTAFPQQFQNRFDNLSAKVSHKNASSSTLPLFFFFCSPKQGPEPEYICTMFHRIAQFLDRFFLMLSYMDSVF